MNGYKNGAIKRSIEKWIKENSTFFVMYENWYCGITKYPDDTRLKQHINKKNIEGLFFNIWETDSVEDANEIEVYFSDKGTINSPSKAGAKKNSKYVYVYKSSPTINESIANLF